MYCTVHIKSSYPHLKLLLSLIISHLPLLPHRVDDDSVGDKKNAKIIQRLMPDRDYFVQIQTFSPEGGKFEFSITAW